MATPRLGLVVEDKPTELSCVHINFGVCTTFQKHVDICQSLNYSL